MFRSPPLITSARRFLPNRVVSSKRTPPPPKPARFDARRSALCCGAIVAGSYSAASIWQYESSSKLFGRLRLRENPAAAAAAAGGGILSSPGRRMVLPIIAANGAVFLLWRVKQLAPLMRSYFLSHIESGKSFSQLILPAFSHTNASHLAVNMFVLWSMADAAFTIFGREEQFYATYVSAGAISILGSQLFKSLRGVKAASLGASGALMAIIASVCTQFPESRMMIVFLPFFTFSADSAIKAILAFDTSGLLLGYRRLDHAAHLAGALFGIWYVKYGHKYLWDKQRRVAQWWARFTRT